MHGSFAIFNVSMWFRCDRKFGGVGKLNTATEMLYIRLRGWSGVCDELLLANWSEIDKTVHNFLYWREIGCTAIPWWCQCFLSLCTVPEYDMQRILPKNGDYKNCMFLSDGSGSPIQELDHNGTFLRKENQSSQLNYISVSCLVCTMLENSNTLTANYSVKQSQFTEPTSKPIR